MYRDFREQRFGWQLFDPSSERSRQNPDAGRKPWLEGLSTVAATWADNQPSPALLLYSKDVIDKKERIGTIHVLKPQSDDKTCLPARRPCARVNLLKSSPLNQPLYHIYARHLCGGNANLGPHMSRQSLPATRSILGNPTKRNQEPIW